MILYLISSFSYCIFNSDYKTEQALPRQLLCWTSVSSIVHHGEVAPYTHLHHILGSACASIIFFRSILMDYNDRRKAEGNGEY